MLHVGSICHRVDSFVELFLPFHFYVGSGRGGESRLVQQVSLPAEPSREIESRPVRLRAIP